MISVEIKYSSFKTASHQMTLTAPTNTSQVIYDASCRLFLELWNGSPIRLLGVRSSKLADPSEPSQLSLFDFEQEAPSASLSVKSKNSPASPSREKLAALDKTLDAIRQKYGNSAVVRGSFLKDD